MLSRTVARSRILPLRPLRPPNKRISTTASRAFKQNHQLLLLAQRASRPQLPYLAQPAFRHRDQYILTGPSQQIARLLSTETKEYVSEQLFLATKWCSIIVVFAALGGVAWFGINMAQAESRNPTPDEWSFRSRAMLRAARRQREDGERSGVVNWIETGITYRVALKRLEDAAIDGKGIEEQGDGGLLIPDVGKAGYDISGKSWPWRASYFEVIMGCAAAAEQLENQVVDKTRKHVFLKEHMVGPSNPDPRPVPSYYPPAPLEENCEPAYAPPETYYMRVLTGKGFTTKQKLDAAFAYANWLEFKGLNDTAEEMYRWGVDIAKTALEVDSATVMDERTFVLKPDSTTGATPNLLRATKTLAIHQARSGNVSSALPILLSVLRARRNAPVSPFPTMEPHDPSKEQSKTDIGQALIIFRNIFSAPVFPSPPPSGDLPLVRPTDKPTCDDSELMLYIGEILFATSPSSSEGLGWTREAVTVAEANLQSSHQPSGSDRKTILQDRIKCKECLATGVNNWETMLRRITDQQVGVVGREGSRNAGWFEWRGWFGGSGGVKGRTLDELSAGVLGEELKQVERLKERIVREGIDQELEKARGSSALWIGG